MASDQSLADIPPPWASWWDGDWHHPPPPGSSPAFPNGAQEIWEKFPGSRPPGAQSPLAAPPPFVLSPVGYAAGGLAAGAVLSAFVGLPWYYGAVLGAGGGYVYGLTR